jgi:hypothetical protein
MLAATGATNNRLDDDQRQVEIPVFAPSTAALKCAGGVRRHCAV